MSCLGASLLYLLNMQHAGEHSTFINRWLITSVDPLRRKGFAVLLVCELTNKHHEL